MTDRDRLIELLKKAEDKYCDICAECAEDLGYEDHETFEDFFAEYLLANGVIVPPCKVGDKVYQTDGVRIYESEVKEIYQDRIATIIYDTTGIAFDERAIGKSIFLTKEEAEEKLKELNKNA